MHIHTAGDTLHGYHLPGIHMTYLNRTKHVLHFRIVYLLLTLLTHIIDNS